MSAVKQRLIELAGQVSEDVETYEEAFAELQSLAVLEERIAHSEECGAIPADEFRKQREQRRSRI